MLTLKDFRAEAQRLEGSRDFGAQLYCALLRSAGVEARLVCSLQPLAFAASGKGPVMPKSTPTVSRHQTPEHSDNEQAIDVQSPDSPFKNRSGPSTPNLPFTARRRLGHPGAADYHMPNTVSPAPPPKPKPKPKRIIESPFPVYWVEVLDRAHQKWLAVDPLVTNTVAQAHKLEPPANDAENHMSYVVAFEEDRYAKDVTRRYTKAFNAKTRKTRVEVTPNGPKWWRRIMRYYDHDYKTELDQVEDSELAAKEAQEPMPKNVQDFKDHPYYALERHLRANEVLIGRGAIGKVAGAKDTSVPGGKKLENVFRRSDVKITKSADGWYRLGREVRVGEQPVKIVPAKQVRRDEDDLGMMEDAETPGKGLYTEAQTEIFEAPPVVNGRVPKNSFGNIDVYVPSMVPNGGVHLPCKCKTLLFLFRISP